MTTQTILLLILAGGTLVLLGIATHFSGQGSLDSIKSKAVGDGQHGTARWATKMEIRQTYALVPFTPEAWRKGESIPQKQGLVLGSVGAKGKVKALVDTGDVHCLMIGASGMGKTAYFLYPNLEYACASGMSFFVSDTKGDLARNYGAIVRDRYGYQVAVIDLRNPTRSDGYNLMALVNRYMDVCRKKPDDLAARAKAENYAKKLAGAIISPGGGDHDRGQNAYFYEAAEGLLASVIYLLAEYLPPTDADPRERRHIVSVFKLIQDLLAPSRAVPGKNGFQTLMALLPPGHRANMLAGSAINTSEQAMLSVISTALSRMISFLDAELEQVICFDSAIDAESFAAQKSAIFLVLPEEDPSKNFIASLMIQALSRELFTIADLGGGALKRRVVFFCDEFGTMPAFDVLPLFSAGRSRKLTMVPIIQSLAQLEKNYGKEGAEIIVDNVQNTIFGGFAPNSRTAEALSKALGDQTVQSGSVSRGRERSQSLQMVQRPLMTPDELRSMPKGQFVVMKTGTHPMRTRLRLFLDWGITFGEPYQPPERTARSVAYASRRDLERAILRERSTEKPPEEPPKPSKKPKEAVDLRAK